MQGGRKQYGLQLQIKGPPKKQPTARPSPAAAFRFNDGDDDEGNVEADIARQAHKKRNVREVEQQYQKALEEDPTAFDYDGVYDEMKGNQARPIHEDRAKREPKYIAKLLEKAKVRAREQDIVYERQLAKEREKEDHLFGDKEKFVTGAYKKKLQEQAKWLEEERRREAQEQRHEVTNKSDMSDFYRNLLKGNVAFGANNVRKPGEKPSVEAEKDAERPVPQVEDEEQPLPSSTTAAPVTGASRSEEARDIESSSTPVASSSRSRDTSDEQRSGAKEKSAERSLGKEEVGDVPKDVKQPVEDVNEPVEAAKQPPVDPVAAAKERYLARKRQRGL